MKKTTKLQPNGGQNTSISLGEGFIPVSRTLIDRLLKMNAPLDYVVCYEVLLCLARHQQDSTEQGVCHAEVQIGATELSRLLNMTENRLRNCIYWLESMQFITKRLINGRRVILLTQYDQHTCQQKRRAKRAALPPSTPAVDSDFNEEIVWE